jgi:internalin A
MDSFPTPPLVRQLVAEARAAGAAYLDLSADTLGFALPAFPPELLDLPGLRTLDFHGHALQALSPTLERLAGLESLDLRRNPIRHLPDVALPPLIIDTLQWHHLAGQLRERAIYGLHILREDLDAHIDFLAEGGRWKVSLLSLAGAGLAEIPLAVWDLTNLEYLDLSFNQLSALPDAIKQLQRLRSLDLS